MKKNSTILALVVVITSSAVANLSCPIKVATFEHSADSLVIDSIKNMVDDTIVILLYKTPIHKEGWAHPAER